MGLHCESDLVIKSGEREGEREKRYKSKEAAFHCKLVLPLKPPHTKTQPSAMIERGATAFPKGASVSQEKAHLTTAAPTQMYLCDSGLQQRICTTKKGCYLLISQKDCLLTDRENGKSWLISLFCAVH